MCDFYRVSLDYEKLGIHSPEMLKARLRMIGIAEYRAMVNEDFKTKSEAESAIKQLPNPGDFYVAEAFYVQN